MSVEKAFYIEPGVLACGVETYNSGVTPLGNRVLVYPIPPKDKIGSIILPQSTVDAEASRQIKVVVILMGISCDVAGLHGGDMALISKWAGYLFVGLDGKNYRIIHQDDLTARIDEAFD